MDVDVYYVAMSEDLLLNVLGVDSFCEEPRGDRCVFRGGLGGRFEVYRGFYMPLGEVVSVEVFEVAKRRFEYLYSSWVEVVGVGRLLYRRRVRFPVFDRVVVKRILEVVFRHGPRGVYLIGGRYGVVGRRFFEFDVEGRLIWGRL